MAVPEAFVSSQKRSAMSYARVLFETLTRMATTAATAEEEDEDYLAVVDCLSELYGCLIHQNGYGVALHIHHTLICSFLRLEHLCCMYVCLLYTSPSPRDATLSRMPSSA